MNQVVSLFSKQDPGSVPINRGLGAKQKKILILVASSILVAFLANLMLSNFLGWRKKVRVFVAKQEVSSWTALKQPAKLFEEEERKESEVPEDHISSWEDFTDTILVRDLQAGQVLCKSALMVASKAGLEGQLKQGMRAVAVETNAVTVAGGFVRPDCFVDVLHTGLDERRNSVTTVILQDIHVLAEDRSTQPGGDTPGKVPATVTLEVDPQQAMELAKVKEAGGSITLLLRPFGDHEISRQRPVHVKNKDRTKGFGSGTDMKISGSRSKNRFDTRVYDPEDVAPDPAVVAGLKSPPPPGRSVPEARPKN